MNWKFVIKTMGYIIVIESIFMFLSAFVAQYFHGWDTLPIVLAAITTLLSGLGLSIPMGFKKDRMIGKKEGYISVAFSWISFAFFGALPFWFSRAIPNFTNAFFESMSGITTTGGSILTNIDSMPRGILFWRSILQWMGGMGIIVFSIALLPLLGGEAAQLFDAESSGLTHDKFQPRVTQMAKRLWGIYLLFTFLSIFFLWLGPMGVYDAVCHGFTTISTGGFSTRQASIAHWNSPYTELTVIVFMIIGAINFPLLYFLLFKGKFGKFFRDEELRWFLCIIFATAFIVGIVLIIYNKYNIFFAFRQSLFQVVSIITTTGFSTDDFTSWGSFNLLIFLFLMITCGCAGSTSGGLKTVRIVVLVKNTIHEFERLIHPRAVIPVRLNEAALSFGTVQRLLAFVFLYICIIFISWGILTVSGIPFVDALGAAVSAISNVGPGFGALGPNGSFEEISLFAKWYLSFLMLIGRLEIFTVLILFSPGFWKK